MTQTFSTVAGEGTHVRFDWNLLTEEWSAAPTYDDFAVVYISGVGVINLANVTDAVLTDTSPAGTYRTTGWNTAEFFFGGAGTYTISVAVFDVEDDFIPTTLLVDNFMIVPEPGSALLLGLGLVGLARVRRSPLPSGAR